MWFKKLISKIGHFFENLFVSAEHAYNHLEPAIQDVLKEATGIVAFINQNIEQTPGGIKQLILEAFPALTEDDLKVVLAHVSTELNLGVDATSGTLEDFVAAVQAYLKSRTGKVWASASDLIAQSIAIFRAPADSKATTLITLISTVYHMFFYKAKP